MDGWLVGEVVWKEPFDLGVSPDSVKSGRSAAQV